MDETEVAVHVEEGVVTLQGGIALSGVAGGHAKKLAAEEAARRVAGVRQVANALQAQPPGAPDGPA